MKRFMVMVVSVSFLLVAQSAMAFSGNAVTGIFPSEQDAIEGGVELADQIKMGTHPRVQSEVWANCQTQTNLALVIKEFTVEPVWVENGSVFEKGFRADVRYRIDCEAPYGR